MLEHLLLERGFEGHVRPVHAGNRMGDTKRVVKRRENGAEGEDRPIARGVRIGSQHHRAGNGAGAKLIAGRGVGDSEDGGALEILDPEGGKTDDGQSVEGRRRRRGADR